ncbi:hypothetical protein C8Q79DRAFT_1014895 [Trametes meyenii]|nr:hypothetical protein C8Q79DRAFT_1014895 [Trametes meyenii]
MASQAERNDIIDLYGNIFSENCFQYTLPTLLAYDYLITLNQEVKLFWRRRFNVGSALFFVTRYFVLLNYVILGNIPSPNDPYIPLAAFSALRVLALSNMRWSWSAMVFILSLGPALVNYIEFAFGKSGTVYLTLGCQQSDHVTQKQREICESLAGVSRGSLILADALVIVVTIAATRGRGYLRTLTGGKASLGDVLFYNGIKYFVILLCMNVLQVMLTHLSIGAVANVRATYLSALALPLSAIFVERFLMDLQAANEASVEWGSRTLELVSDVTTGGGLRFARTIEMFGASTAGVESRWIEADNEQELGSYTDVEEGEGAWRGDAGNAVRDGAQGDHFVVMVEGKGLSSRGSAAPQSSALA